MNGEGNRYLVDVSFGGENVNQEKLRVDEIPKGPG